MTAETPKDKAVDEVRIQTPMLETAIKPERVKQKNTTRRVSFNLTDLQYQNFVKAAENLHALGIPVQPQALIQTLVSNKSANEISEDFLSMMKKLINEGKKKLRQNKNIGMGS